jgi:hypothetical protein
MVPAAARSRSGWGHAMDDERGRAAEQPGRLVIVAEALVGLDDEHHRLAGPPGGQGQAGAALGIAD